MYEFSKKEIREKFKKTEYGNKLNSYLYLSLLAVFFLFVIVCFLHIYYYGREVTEQVKILLMGLDAIFFIAIVTGYFDGKRDGAIRQFTLSLKKD